ncbi:hypothetical protein HN51_058692 [Arachis hypogaea]|uniref:Uncharacterized protein n=1 Tax=Arachis hypogaea TaxID=3818 RepID=A0A444X261_ARAHY|nr:uncharacterized protein LOC107620467 [Arachis ipaensis]XP_025684946.1 uncharacterized protein LOC112785720 [Arachis hypogaea]RYQ83749.1 hypothetical protein Ahy_B10g102565 [Arachis hypogaea]
MLPSWPFKSTASIAKELKLHSAPLTSLATFSLSSTSSMTGMPSPTTTKIRTTHYPLRPYWTLECSFFSQGDRSVYQEKPYFGLPKLVYKRFVFEASKIEALKATIAPIHQTRFEAVAALICKCTAFALGLCPNSSLLSTVAVNLHKRMDPPVPSKTLGNMITFFIFGHGGGGGGNGGSGGGGG